MTAWTNAYNLQPNPKLNNSSPMQLRHPTQNVKNISIIPFGSAVVYPPKPTLESKWDGRGLEGVFFGEFSQSDGSMDGSWGVF